MVTPSRANTSGVRCGSNPSMRMFAPPVSRLENSQVMPPMWVNGKARPLRSRWPKSSRSDMPRAVIMMVASVCCAPFGSAVVPDV